MQLACHLRVMVEVVMKKARKIKERGTVKADEEMVDEIHHVMEMVKEKMEK